MLGVPLADAAAMERDVAEGVEHLVSAILMEHLGVTLRSTPAL